MTSEQAKQLSDAALNRLMEALDRGHSEALKRYLAVMARFHRYSWTNILLIQTQRPDATHVAGSEAVAFVVYSAIGLASSTSSSDYIQLHSRDKSTLTESLAHVQQIASEILQVVMSGDSEAPPAA